MIISYLERFYFFAQTSVSGSKLRHNKYLTKSRAVLLVIDQIPNRWYSVSRMMIIKMMRKVCANNWFVWRNSGSSTDVFDPSFYYMNVICMVTSYLELDSVRLFNYRVARGNRTLSELKSLPNVIIISKRARDTEREIYLKAHRKDNHTITSGDSSRILV